MNTNTVIHKFLVVILSLCLIAPGAALAGGKSGKKNFKEGVKYEQLQQWDMAAQQFALAVAAEPNNPEYKLHYLRALQQASIMYVKRGESLSEQGDYAGAYTAFRQAYNYDQGNEISRLKMERMLEQQKAQASGAEVSVPNRIGNVMPVSNEIPIAAKPRSKDVVQSITFKDSKFKVVVGNLGKQLGLNVVFDESVKDVPVSIDLTDVTVAKALDIIFKTYKFSFEQVDRRTILVYVDNPTNRPRFESLLVKTFYLGNITAQQARTALQAMLPPGRQMASMEQANAAGGNLLIVKATQTELQLVQNILDSLDKNKNEVVLDVEIYEVSHDSLLQIGNQIATSPTDFISQRTDKDGVVTNEAVRSAGLNNLGGIGLNLAGTTASAGNSLFNIGSGLLLGLPPTSLSLLQSKGNSKLLYRTQIHVLDGQKNTTKVGRSVPVRLGTTYPGGGIGVLGGGTNTGNAGGGGINNGLLGGLGGGGIGYGGFDSIQYRDVGLVIEAKPAITNEGYVEIEMKFETSDVQASGSDTNLTPTFTQRSLNTTARIQDGVTSVVAGVNQETKGDSRAGIPVLGMVPILGRLFTAPRQESRQSDIIITVTPHIVRSQGIDKDDHLAQFAGQQTSGPAPSVEEVVFRAQQEDEQERRLIAQQIPTTTPLGAPDQGSAVNAGFNQPQRPAQTTVQPVVNSNSGPRQQQQRVINNQSLQQTSASLNSAPAGNYQPQTAAPEPQQQYVQQPVQQPAQPAAQPAAQQTAAPTVQQVSNNAGEAPSAAQPAAAGESAPETSTLVDHNPGFVKQNVGLAQRPEHVEKAIAKMRAEKEAADRLARENAAKNKGGRPAEAAPEPFVKQTVQQPAQKVAVATPTFAEKSGGNTAINLTLSPKPIRQQPGKNFTVAVEVNSQAQMTGANIALRFDSTKLQVKSVRDGGMLGAQPELNYEVERGNLIVRMKQSSGGPVKANGRLIVIEFAAISEGQTEIAINSTGTQIRLPGNLNSQAIVSATPVFISKDSLATER